MSGSIIGLDDYAGYEGFGTAPHSDVTELLKALEAGHQVSGQTGGSALRVESLESSLKVLTYTSQDFRFWRDIPKLPAYSTVEEYNQLIDYGTNAGAAVPEGHLPELEDTNYARKTSLVKFYGTTRAVTHPATMVRVAHGDVIALENMNGINWLLRRIEQALLWGDSTLTFGGEEGVEFDGIDKLIPDTNVIDLQGNPMTESDIETGANFIRENFGLPNYMLIGTRVKSDLVKQFYPRERVQMPAPTGGNIGFNFDNFVSCVGPIRIAENVFLQPAPQAPATATSAKAPTALASIAEGGLTGTDGEFAKSGVGVYKYKATAANRFGESAATAASTGATFGAADLAKHVPLTITNSGSVVTVPEFINIYRTRPDGTVYFLIARIPADSQANSGTTTVDDLNKTMAGYQKAFMLDLRPDVISFKQLAPLMKMDIARIAPSIRWMILLYGVVQLYAPQKAVKYENIGVLGTELDTLALTQAQLQQVGGGGPIPGPVTSFL